MFCYGADKKMNLRKDQSTAANHAPTHQADAASLQ
jgi:hypothetical protein